MTEIPRTATGRVARSRRVRDAARRRFTRDNAACWLCGTPIDYAATVPHPRALVADHVIPLIAGGADTLDNMRPAHYSCNDRKRANTQAPVIRRTATLNY